MSGWRQAVFLRQRRIDVIQGALSKLLDEESWSAATPRRLRIGSADSSSCGWTMIAPELANFFLDRGGLAELRLCRLARALHCPVYEVDVRDATATTLCEVDPHGRVRSSGAPLAELEPASRSVGFELIEVAGDRRDRIAALAPGGPMALADYLGALAGFPGWTRHGDAAIAAGEIVYEPPRIVTARGSAQIAAQPQPYALVTTPPPETRAATARTSRRDALPAHDRTGRRLRSVSRPRR